MLELFAATFVAAITFSVFLLLTLRADIEEKSFRPLYLFTFAIIAWMSTVPSLIIGNNVVTSYGAYNIISNSTLGNVITQYQAYNVTTHYNLPFSIPGFWTWFTFVSAMVTIHIVMFYLYLTGWFLIKLKDIRKTIGN